MSENNLITFWSCDISELSEAELKIERNCQKHLRGILNRDLQRLQFNEKTKNNNKQRLNNIDFIESIINELDGFIAEMDERLALMVTPDMDKKEKVRRRNLRKPKSLIERETKAAVPGLSWDKDKFMLVARDRGYLSEQSITAAVAKELDINLAKARSLLKLGRFTWGQTMCIGALLKMNPKEFCDIFLSGYFVEYYGEYIASYENIKKSELLIRAIT